MHPTIYTGDTVHTHVPTGILHTGISEGKLPTAMAQRLVTSSEPQRFRGCAQRVSVEPPRLGIVTTPKVGLQPYAVTSA